MTRMVHLAGGRTFIAPEPAPPPARPTRMAQAAAAASERRRIDRLHREMLDRPPMGPSERRYGPCALLDRRRDQCAYMAEGPTCCGARTVIGTSWCSEHYRIVFPAPRRPERLR